MKAAAILLVIAFHYFGQLAGWHMKVVPTDWFMAYWQHLDAVGVVRFIEAYFYLGVNMFVIASGFGLYLSHLNSGRTMSLKEFFYKRIVRLLPAAILSIAVVFILKGLFLEGWIINNWYINLFPFFGGLNLFSDSWFFPPINGELWFLGLIIQLYLFFPLLTRMLKNLGRRNFLVLLFVVSVIFRAVYYWLWKDTVSSLSYGLSIGRLFEFGFGMVLADMFVKKEKLSPWWLAGLGLFFGYFFQWTFPFTDSLLGVGAFSLVWLLAGKIGYSKLIAKISAESYLMFLLHHPFIWILNKAGLTDFWNWYGVLIFPLLFAFSYFVARLAQRKLGFEFRLKKTEMSV